MFIQSLQEQGRWIDLNSTMKPQKAAKGYNPSTRRRLADAVHTSLPVPSRSVSVAARQAGNDAALGWA